MLKTQIREINGTEYTVTTANLPATLKLSKLREQAGKIAETLPADADVEYTLFIWPMVAAVTVPAPSWDEFIEMRDDHAAALVGMVMELNAHWFEEPNAKN